MVLFILFQNTYNRPSYIKKLKKVAEDFKYHAENSKMHFAIDVVRPAECIREIIRRGNTPDFVDSEFPPENPSIGFEYRMDWILWKKPREVFKMPVFGKYIDPNDIQPGTMSSPQFLSTLSCLAER